MNESVIVNDNIAALRLQVVLRPSTGHQGVDNHFIRLTPHTAQRLRDNGISTSTTTTTTTTTVSLKTPQQSQSRRWWIYNEPQVSSSQCLSGIEFLPLAITFENSTRKTIYASYNGGNVSDENNNVYLDSSIDIPDFLVKGMTDAEDGIYDQQRNSSICYVSVQPLQYIDSISQLFVEPVTSEDWELLELDAISLEEGRFLQQISIVYSGQIIHLTLSNDSRARFIVLPRNFERIDIPSVWPKDTTTTTTANCQRYPCYRLLAETEIIITPKPRPPNHPVEYPLRLIPTKQDYHMMDPGIIELSKHLNINLISVPQGSLVIHPNTLARIRGKDVEEDDLLLAVVQVVSTVTPDINNDETVSGTVRIVVSMNVPEEHVALHPFVRLRINAPIFGDPMLVSIKKFLAPIDVTKLSTIVLDLVHVGEISVRFKPVWLIPSQNVHSWRSPTYDVGDTVDTNVWLNEPDESKNVEMMPDFPVNFGGVFSLPNQQNRLYHLDVQSNDRSKSTECGFLFSRQLAKLWNVIQFDEEKDFYVTKEMIVPIDETKTSRLLSRLLPSHSICASSSILRLIQKSLLRSSVLVHGDTGCGKTFTSLLIAAVARLLRGDRCVYLGCRKLRDSETIRMKSMITEFEEAFDDACKFGPCVVILDDLDLVAPSFQIGASADSSSLSHDVSPTEIDQSKLVSDVLRHIMRSKKHGIFVVATSATNQSLSRLLLSEGSFSHQLDVPELTNSDREVLYRSLLNQFTACRQVPVSWSKDSSFIRKTSGYRPRDLKVLAFRTYNNLSLCSSKRTLNEATSTVLQGYVPLSRMSSNTEEVSDEIVKLRDMGGLRQPKSELISTIVRPSIYRRIYDQAKVRLPRGVLLFGFPGTGKSICVPALARECGYPLITCRGPELLDKYIGASEAKIRALFMRAAATAPSILFLDELDALAPRRGSDHTGVTDRIVNQLLTFLDGVEDISGNGNGTVYVIGATSRPDKVDPALLRPGRLEKHIYFGLSDDPVEAKELLLKISENYSLDTRTKSAILSGEIVQDVSATNHMFRFFSAADFTAIFNAAQLTVVRRALDLGCTDEAPLICYNTLYEAMMSARPSISQQDYVRLSEIYNPYRQGTAFHSSSERTNQIPPILTALK